MSQSKGLGPSHCTTELSVIVSCESFSTTCQFENYDNPPKIHKFFRIFQANLQNHNYNSPHLSFLMSLGLEQFEYFSVECQILANKII